MKKLTLIISHSDIANVLSELIASQCLEPTTPDIPLDPPELSDLVRNEVMELEAYDANFNSIDVLATQYTYTITGWLPAMLEHELTSMLTRFSCAWEITDPGHNDDDIPTILKYPQVFGKLRSGGRRVFEPLAKMHS
ncbi:MAG: hypothetical protein FWD44_02265 [Oscillospiraceae bacterium]|nr:hypothetical protein [Oscillospiraceae bacterium]